MCAQCGGLTSECSDASIDWHPRKAVCWRSATNALAWRHLRDKHAKKQPEPDRLHPLDGVSMWLSKVPPPEDQDEFKFR